MKIGSRYQTKGKSMAFARTAGFLKRVMYEMVCLMYEMTCLMYEMVLISLQYFRKKHVNSSTLAKNILHCGHLVQTK